MKIFFKKHRNTCKRELYERTLIKVNSVRKIKSQSMKKAKMMKLSPETMAIPGVAALAAHTAALVERYNDAGKVGSALRKALDTFRRSDQRLGRAGAGAV
jgi:hypothetical protein